MSDKVRTILDFRTNLTTIHRSLDGNGRTVRLLADLLLMRLGLPPPLSPIENDIFGDREQIFQETLKSMEQYLTNLTYKLYKPTQPMALFHWTTPESFQWMDTHPQKLKVPMQTIAEYSNLAMAFPNLAETRGTHAWSNPIKAMRGGKFAKNRIEWYAKPDRDNMVLAYFLKPNARIETVRTVSDSFWESKESFDDVDLIYHQRVDATGKLIYHEWILLNPEIVESWTTDPEKIRPYIESELKKIKKLGKDYPKMDKHFVDPALDTSYALKKKNQIIRNFLGTSGPCLELFNQIGSTDAP